MGGGMVWARSAPRASLAGAPSAMTCAHQHICDCMKKNLCLSLLMHKLEMTITVTCPKGWWCRLNTQKDVWHPGHPGHEPGHVSLPLQVSASLAVKW